MDRVGRTLLGLAGAFTLALAVTGAISVLPLLAGAIIVAALGALLVRAARGRVPVDRWGPGPGAAADQAVEPRQPDAAWQGAATVRSLGRVEARALATNPWFVVGVGLGLSEVVMFGVVWSGDASTHWMSGAISLPLLVHPVVGMGLVAAHRGVTRSRRDGCDELFDSCPLDPGTRLLAHLSTAWVGALAATLTAGALAAFTVATTDPYGALDARLVWVMVSCTVLGAGGVVLGVALGRWVRWALAPLAALLGVVVISERLLRIGRPRWATDQLLATFIVDGAPDPIVLDLPLAERVAWLVGLSVAVAGLALWGRHRAAAPTLVLGVVVALLGAAGVAAPMSDADALAAQAQWPARGEVCVTATPSAPTVVCAPAPYREAAERVAVSVAPTLDALPVGRAPTTLRMVILDRDVEELPVELSTALGDSLVVTEPWGDGQGTVGYATDVGPNSRRAAQLRVAAHALGLPVRTLEGRRPTVVAGRADGVAVLWLGTLGLDEEDRAAALTVRPDGHEDEVVDATRLGQAWPNPCDAGVAPLAWAPQDLAAARALAELPDEAVASLLHDTWDELDEMTTDELLGRAGLDGEGATAEIEARVHECSY